MRRVSRSMYPNLVIVRESFWRGTTLVRMGTIWPADDPVVRGFPAAFGPLHIERSESAVEMPIAPVPQEMTA